MFVFIYNFDFDKKKYLIAYTMNNLEMHIYTGLLVKHSSISPICIPPCETKRCSEARMKESRSKYN